MKAKNGSLFLGLSILLLIGSSNSEAQTPAGNTSSGTAIVQDTIKKADAENLVFDKTEIEASVDAGLWRKHLEANLVAYLEEAARRGIKAGQYTVNVRFLVEKDGRMTNVMALNDPGFGLSKAAQTVVRTGPRWKPGEVNGKKVRSYHTQPITFQIQEK